MMDFNKKEEVMAKIRENGTLQEMLLLYQQMALDYANQIDPALGEQVAQLILSRGRQPLPTQGATTPTKVNEGEHPYVERARNDARASTQAD
jgi:hypothetical protein